MRMISSVSAVLMASLFGSMTVSGAGSAAESPKRPKPVVELAILLDTSNSMDGLIDQAKGQLWKIVNEFVKARQHGQLPEVQRRPVRIRQQPSVPGRGLCADGPTAYERPGPDLGESFRVEDQRRRGVLRVGDPRGRGAPGLEPAPDVYRAIFIAGNEPFTQGAVEYSDSCKAAIEKGIIVNTIHCGDEALGIQTKWQDGALLADGKFMVIDQNRAVVHIDAPQDKEIARLGAELNKTYVAFGSAGAEASARQAAQDANARAMAPSGAAVQSRRGQSLGPRTAPRMGSRGCGEQGLAQARRSENRGTSSRAAEDERRGTPGLCRSQDQGTCELAGENSATEPGAQPVYCRAE